MEKVDITIIGAGVVGLAIAAELSQKFKNITVIEKHKTFGQETSSRNSEVIHSGIYYPEGSLKAALCVEGAEHLYEIYEQFSIPHKKTGKLIIASEQSEIKALEALLEKKKKNGVKDLVILQKNDVSKIEPNTLSLAALYSPNTGIIDSHSLMKFFSDSAADNGVLFAFNSEVNRIDKKNDGFVVWIKQEDYHFESNVVINCAGLYSDYIAGLSGIDIGENDYRLKFCKGSYFSYSKPSPVRMLIYPVPQEEIVGLGVHATLDLANRLRFGPDAEHVEVIDYKVDAGKKESFYKGASKIISGLDIDSFLPDMAGIRPKLQGPREKTRDFVIRDESGNGMPGFINLIGIESPGLTASPSIAKMVGGMITRLMN
ncbi:MAG: NAD(P)/FAD-dependent oxidoreductase [Nitrospirae bacterium]|nr:NAD(P)/FAD-dependent oxidoreductase [Nitrospirota bacterium]